MSELIEHEHLDGHYAVKNRMVSHPVNTVVSDYIEQLQARVDELTEALEFYANPATYYGIAFGPDLSTDFWGPFAADFGGGDTSKPGKKARTALKGVSDE